LLSTASIETVILSAIFKAPDSTERGEGCVRGPALALRGGKNDKVPVFVDVSAL
jgi:hypothetical protein